MFLLRIGVLPRPLVAGRASACLALALALAGCSGKTTETAEVWPWSTPPAKVAAAVPPPKPDLEEDEHGGASRAAACHPRGPR